MNMTNVKAEAYYQYTKIADKDPIEQIFLNDGSRIDKYEHVFVIWNSGKLAIQFEMNSNVYSVELR